MTLLATLNAATAVKYRLEERKAGHDPSDQEDEVFVRDFLYDSQDTLKTLLLDLQASFLFYEDESEDAIAYSLRCFNDLSRFHQLSGLLQQIHQRLLSLYPAISEELAEEARKLSLACHLLIDENRTYLIEDAILFVDRALGFCEALSDEV